MNSESMKEAKDWTKLFDDIQKELNINEASGPDAKLKIAKHAASKVMADKSKGGFKPKNYITEDQSNTNSKKAALNATNNQQNTKKKETGKKKPI